MRWSRLTRQEERKHGRSRYATEAGVKNWRRRRLGSVCIQNKRFGYKFEFKARCTHFCASWICASGKGFRSIQTDPNFYPLSNSGGNYGWECLRPCLSLPQTSWQHGHASFFEPWPPVTYFEKTARTLERAILNYDGKLSEPEYSRNTIAFRPRIDPFHYYVKPVPTGAYGRRL